MWVRLSIIGGGREWCLCRKGSLVGSESRQCFNVVVD